MGLDIVSWDVLEMINLRVPIINLMHWEEYESENDTLVYNLREQVELVGKVHDGYLHVSQVDCFGEGSGNVFYEGFSKAFENSTGVIRAACHWEGCPGGEYFESDEGKVTTGELAYVKPALEPKENPVYNDDWDIADHLVEEFAEVIKALSKYKRFGPDGVDPTVAYAHQKTNLTHLLDEMRQVNQLMLELVKTLTQRPEEQQERPIVR